MAIRILNTEGQWNQPLTPKGLKYNVVDGFISRWNANKSELKMLMQDRKELRSKGKDLSAQDAMKLQKLKDSVEQLQYSIDKEIVSNDLTYTKRNGVYIYHSTREWVEKKLYESAYRVRLRG